MPIPPAMSTMPTARRHGHRHAVTTSPASTFVIVNANVSSKAATSHTGKRHRGPSRVSSASANNILNSPNGYVSGTANQNIAPALHAPSRLNNAASSRRQPPPRSNPYNSARHTPAITARTSRAATSGSLPAARSAATGGYTNNASNGCTADRACTLCGSVRLSKTRGQSPSNHTSATPASTSRPSTQSDPNQQPTKAPIASSRATPQSYHAPRPASGGAGDAGCGAAGDAKVA